MKKSLPFLISGALLAGTLFVPSVLESRDYFSRRHHYPLSRIGSGYHKKIHRLPRHHFKDFRHSRGYHKRGGFILIIPDRHRGHHSFPRFPRRY